MCDVTSSGQPQNRNLWKQAGTAGLDGLHFRFSPWQSVEALGQVAAVEVLARLGLNGTERGTGAATNGKSGTAKGSVLLGLGAIGGEGVRKNTRGRLRMSSRSMVDRSCEGKKKDEIRRWSSSQGRIILITYSE